MRIPATTHNGALRGTRVTSFAGISCLVALLCGCAAQRKSAIPWATAVLVRPTSPQPDAPDVDGEDAVPGLENPPPPAPLITTALAPARPRIPATPSANRGGASPSEKLDPPQIVPGLSAQESGTLQQETDRSLGIAEHNLKASSGRSLNAAQSDLASKVRGFIADSREAAKAGDWLRARDLAKKAQVLSQELAGSL